MQRAVNHEDKVTWVAICGNVLTIVPKSNDKTVCRCDIESKGTIGRYTRRLVTWYHTMVWTKAEKGLYLAEETLAQWDGRRRQDG